MLHTYLENEGIEVDNDAAVKLGCLELRRFYKDMPQIALKKRENFTILESARGVEGREGGEVREGSGERAGGYNVLS